MDFIVINETTDFIFVGTYRNALKVFGRLSGSDLNMDRSTLQGGGICLSGDWQLLAG